MIRTDDLVAERAELARRLRERPSGLAWSHRLSDLADRTLRRIHEYSTSVSEDAAPVALVATGGYGRRELSPHSDLDVTLVPLHADHPRLEETAKTLFHHLQQVCDRELGWKVGYSLRPTADVGGLDAPSRTALIDARPVCGDGAAFDLLSDRLWDRFPVADFILAKLKERRAAHRRHHDSPLVTRPQLKEGAGGLRSFHASNWVKAALGERGIRPNRTYDRVLMVRNLLHLAAGRSQDELTPEKRRAVAEMLGLTPETLAESLAEAMSELHALWETTVDRIHEARFPLTEGCWAVAGEVRVGPHAEAGGAALALSLGTALELQPPKVPVSVLPVTETAQALAALAGGERILRALDRAGLLTVLLPEVTATRNLIPKDEVHDFTVMEHTFRVIRNIENPPPGTFLAEIAAGLRERTLITMAALLHDAGKIDSSREHSEAGAEIAREVAERFRIAPTDRETLVWLVRHHLMLARTIRMRDVQSPETVHECAEAVETQERMDLLTLLTWADIAAVSSQSWTGVQETYLAHLYRSVTSVLQEQAEKPDESQVRRRLQRHLTKTRVPDAEIALFLEAMPAHYVFSTPAEVVPRHIEMVRSAREGNPEVLLLPDRQLSASELTVAAPDRPGLLSDILSVLYAEDLRLVGVRASTTADSQPTVLDTFLISYGDRPIPDTVGARLQNRLQDLLAGTLDPDEYLARRGKDPNRVQDLLQWEVLPGP
ncbi:MAG: HD domain-containing protein, partial [Fimbriimonadaceae bacterium]|nr:HD domain-containing protein [Fimbriimonadaceae bacterium]